MITGFHGLGARFWVQSSGPELLGSSFPDVWQRGCNGDSERFTVGVCGLSGCSCPVAILAQAWLRGPKGHCMH